MKKFVQLSSCLIVNVSSVSGGLLVAFVIIDSPEMNNNSNAPVRMQDLAAFNSEAGSEPELKHSQHGWDWEDRHDVIADVRARGALLPTVRWKT